MNDDGSRSLLAGLAGLLVGGALARAVSDLASVAIATSTVLGVLSAGWATHRGKDPTRATMIGAAIGVGIGLAIAVIDALFFRG